MYIVCFTYEKNEKRLRNLTKILLNFLETLKQKQCYI